MKNLPPPTYLLFSKRFCTTVILIVLLCSFIEAQVPSLFTSVDPATELNEAEMGLYNKYVSSPAHNVVGVAEVGLLSASLTESNYMIISVPGVTPDAAFRFSGGTQDDEVYTWYGVGDPHTEENDGLPLGDELLLAEAGGEYYGHMNIDSIEYQFLPLLGDEGMPEIVNRPRVVIFTQPNSNKICGMGQPFMGNLNTHGSSGKPKNKPRLDNMKMSDPCLPLGEVSVLILFTPQANNESPDIVAQARAAYYQTKQVVANTNADDENFSTFLAGIEPVNLNETNDIFDDHDAWNGDNTVQNLRNDNDADVVMILSGERNSDVHGVAFFDHNNPAQFTSVLEHTNAVGERIYAHEFGHLIGGRHEDSPSTNRFPINDFQRGYDFSTGTFPFLKRRGTILATRDGISTRPKLNSAERRILSYSNPRNEFNNKRAGSFNNNDMRSWIDNVVSARAVAQYIQNPMPLRGYVTQSTLLCNCETRNFSITTVCEEGDVSYVWEWSDNHVDYTQVSTSPTYSYTGLCNPTSPNPPTEIIRVRITDDNETRTITFVPHTLPPQASCTSNRGVVDDDREEGYIHDGNISVYPNPQSGENGSSGIVVRAPEDMYDPSGSVVVLGGDGRKLTQNNLAGMSVLRHHSNANPYVELPVQIKNVCPGLHVVLLRDRDGEILGSTKLIITEK